LIERNTTIPTRKSQVFSTAEDNQTAVDVHVLQGEREFAADNKTLGKFRLEGIPAAPRGVPQVEVTFDIDANGIVHVSAKDKGTNKEQKITISDSSGLSKDEVENLVKQAQMHEAEDKKRRETVDKRNHLDSLITSIEKTITDNKEKLPADEVTNVEKALEDARVALKEHENNAEELQKATDVLTKASHKVAEIIYKEKQQEAQEQKAADADAAPEQAGPAGNEGPIETDFEQKQ